MTDASDITTCDPAPGYRPCVGAVLVKTDGLLWIGRRSDHPENVRDDNLWQMPQGGIDPGEDPTRAVLRELYEETNVRRVTVLAETCGWLRYDIPKELLGQGLWKGRFRGQTQKWFLLRFDGAEAEIDIASPAGGAHKPEFDAWRWAAADDVIDVAVAFKRDVYRAVIGEFAPRIADLRAAG